MYRHPIESKLAVIQDGQTGFEIDTVFYVALVLHFP